MTIQIISVILLLSSLVAPVPLLDQSFPALQQILPHSSDDEAGPRDIREELRKAEIIPTVLDDFTPALTLAIAWPWKHTSKHNVTASLGNTLDPSLLQHSPNAYLDAATAAADDAAAIIDSDDPSAHPAKKRPDIVLTLTDPDAPSRDDPKWSEMCHWVVLVPRGRGAHPREVVPYKAPGPPPRTGKHRYVFAAWVAANGTTDALEPAPPRDRQHWGYDVEKDGEAGRVGVRRWAADNGLRAVAANFIYAQNEKQ